MLAIPNPAPGSPYHTAIRFELNTTWDEPFAVLDCASSGSIALDGAPRAGAFVRACIEGAQQGTDTFTLAPGPYAATFSTQGAPGVSIYGVRHAWPVPRE